MGEAAVHVVFDLDDTLYGERDYVYSALDFVGQLVAQLYGRSTATSELHRLYSAGDPAPLQRFWSDEALPAEALPDCIAAMRAHRPKITLRDDAKAVIAALNSRGIQWSILTDGRSVTQRQKIKALGLDRSASKIYISQECGVAKPALAAFTQIERDFSETMEFLYIADNPRKDFSAPNELGWMTFMLLDNGFNIHKQDNGFSASSKAKETIESLPELLSFF
ncbi:HAD family hydrolase [Novosphingobium sp.]|uniref:HAD family hydrolase n=1 Tax=Novosphingobium sp. TaxID=1874826 RepID=UPI0022C73F13|nr:HAD family hydrolase [Novosphingobium sp.]MCZ8075270.1 HAD family hydrolase [Roseateles sp.]MCZ8085652.1 HAD family hydrolase [Paracoccaceae bacterium]MCZ8036419.1 HAD family hydrolase [Novosphingobium sp.]MCZ8233488.1 HAD family hydrolase [Novosphingobium sp.]MCZ8265147.1 HAD family hydrolase [Novosphingobium sp.]